METYNLFVWSEPVEGQEDVYNDWYDNIHLDDVRAIPEFVGATRFKFSSETPTPRKYLAVYDIETNEPSTIMERLTEAAAKLFISPALDSDRIILSIMRKI
jgi:hypothetical protein